jgi:hypothetical protein
MGQMGRQVFCGVGMVGWAAAVWGELTMEGFMRVIWAWHMLPFYGGRWAAFSCGVRAHLAAPYSWPMQCSIALRGYNCRWYWCLPTLPL